jgi:hypothetical protein
MAKRTTKAFGRVNNCPPRIYADDALRRPAMKSLPSLPGTRPSEPAIRRDGAFAVGCQEASFAHCRSITTLGKNGTCRNQESSLNCS